MPEVGEGLFQMIAEDFSGVVMDEGGLPGNEGVPGGGEGIEVGAGVEGDGAGDLFRGGVAGGADKGSGEGQIGFELGCFEETGEAEVNEFDGSLFSAHQIGRLEIAVNDVGFMCGGKSKEGIADGESGGAPIHGAVRVEFIGE